MLKFSLHKMSLNQLWFQYLGPMAEPMVFGMAKY